jgi:hypothetical protein
MGSAAAHLCCEAVAVGVVSRAWHAHSVNLHTTTHMHLAPEKLCVTRERQRYKPVAQCLQGIQPASVLPDITQLMETTGPAAAE